MSERNDNAVNLTEQTQTVLSRLLDGELSSQRSIPSSENKSVASPVNLAYLLDLVPMEVARFDVQALNLTYCNHAWAHYRGSEAAKLIGHTNLAQSLSDCPSIAKRVEQVLAGLPVHQEYPRVFPDGLTIEYEKWLIPEKNQAGEVIGILVLARDIDDRKSQENLINQALERLDFAVRAANLFIWEWQIDEDILLIEGDWSRVIGGESAKQHITTTAHFFTQMHPDDRPRAYEKVIGNLKGKESELKLEFRQRKITVLPQPDKPIWCWLFVRGGVVEREAQTGKALRMAGVFLDISERKRSELELQASEERFKTLLELSTDYYWEIDHQFRFTKMQGRSMQLLEESYLPADQTGTVEQFFIGKTRWEMDTHTIITEGVDWATHKAMLEAHQPFEILLENKNKNGNKYYYEVRGVPFYDEQKQLAGYRGISHDITQRIRDEARVRHLAYHDPLTNLPNRTLLQDMIERTLSEAKRYQQSVGLLFVDLDNFKTINDTLGHEFGDIVLSTASQRFMAQLRETDTLARFAGDEFVVMLPNLPDRYDALVVAEKLLASMSDPIIHEGKEVYITASIGVAIYPEDADSVESLLTRADTAMYAAKQTGRNTYHFFTKELNEQTLKRLIIKTDMRAAFERGEFEVYYQPKFELSTLGLVGAEALLRWRRPDGTFVPPTDFISVAEENGMINMIGQWVLQKVIEQTTRWHHQGMALSVAVNVSAVQLRQSHFVAQLEMLLAEHNLPPEAIILELTETALLDNNEVSDKLIKQLDHLGFRLSLDDFGTGFSSLSYLQRFPFKEIKIDRTFVRDICDDARDASLVRAIIHLAKDLGIKVVAEGIENKRQLTMLAFYGCLYGQGFFFSEAQPADEFDRRYIEGKLT